MVHLLTDFQSIKFDFAVNKIAHCAVICPIFPFIYIFSGMFYICFLEAIDLPKFTKYLTSNLFEIKQFIKIFSSCSPETNKQLGRLKYFSYIQFRYSQHEQYLKLFHLISFMPSNYTQNYFRKFGHVFGNLYANRFLNANKQSRMYA